MKYTLNEIVDLKIGRTPPRKESKWFNTTGEGYKWVSIKDMGNCGKYISDSSEYLYCEAQKNFSIPIVEKNTVLLSFKLTVGRVCITTDKMLTNEAIAQLPIKDTQKVDTNYLYYYLKNYDFNQLGSTSSIANAINSSYLRRMEIDLPSIEMQKKIGKVLSVIDAKIDNNNAIIDNLQQQVFALYRQMFVDSVNVDRCVCRAEQYFDISIGKTPPRKEPEWFSAIRDNNVVWVSISDMGSCGMYISDSSEYLTRDAVNRFNVVTVPDNTVILSFKLTVGRVAITDGEMTTNEAIAHFKTNKKEINEYLYCYLKAYNYQTMGSTSSIATAVNSKIIKAMPFIVPTDDELTQFHSFASPCFEEIRNNQIENARLAALRDTLLPKLMSGEIDVLDVDI